MAAAPPEALGELPVREARLTLAAVAADLYRALQTKPCACIWHWCDKGYVVKTQCAGCLAIEAYETFGGRENPEWTADDFARARPAAEVLPASLLRKTFGGRERAA